MIDNLDLQKTYKDTGPRHIQLELTSICRNHCRFCPQQSLYREGNMSMKLFYKAIREIKDLNDEKDSIDRITVSWMGEPTNIDLNYKIRYLKKHLPNIQTEIYTTLLGSKLDLEVLLNIDLIRVTFASHDAETSKKMSDLDWNQQLKNLKELVELRNQFEKPMLITACCVNSKVLNPDEFILKFQEIADLAYITPYFNFFDKVDLSMSLEKFTNQNSRDCYLPYIQFLIASNGRVSLCSHDFNLIDSIGDFNSKSIRTLWNSEKAENKRSQMRERIETDNLCTSCFINRYV